LITGTKIKMTMVEFISDNRHKDKDDYGGIPRYISVTGATFSISAA